MTPLRRILVVRTDRIGDVVLATPLIRALRRANPDAWIAAMVRPYAEPVLRGNPFLNEIILDDPGSVHAGVRGFFSQVRRLAAGRFDTALILLPKSRLSWMLFFAGVRRRVSVGLRLDHLLTLTRWVTRDDYRENRHEAEYCLDLGSKIGVPGDGTDVDVFVADREREVAGARLSAAGAAQDDILVGIHPGSKGSAPNWNPDQYGELMEVLLRHDQVRIVLTGSAAEAPVLQGLAAVNPGRVLPLPSEDLRETIATISLLRVLVSASTGPMHIAAGLKVPTVSMFCPLTACAPARWGPRGNKSVIIEPVVGYCQERCPGDPHVCTFEGGISPRTVAEAVGRIVG